MARGQGLALAGIAVLLFGILLAQPSPGVMGFLLGFGGLALALGGAALVEFDESQ